MPQNVGAYTKSIVAILAAGATILATALTDNVVTAVEYVNIAIAIVTAVSVFGLKNLPEGPRRYTKSIVAFAGAALATLITVLGTNLGFLDVTASDWITVFLAGLGAIGIAILPNNTVPDVEVFTVNNFPVTAAKDVE